VYCVRGTGEWKGEREQGKERESSSWIFVEGGAACCWLREWLLTRVGGMNVTCTDQQAEMDVSATGHVDLYHIHHS